MISSPSPRVPCQLCCPVSPVRHCSLAQHEGRDSRAPQSWHRAVSPKPKVLGDPQVPAWCGVLPALSCAMMGTVPPHWDSTMLLHGPHPGTGPRSHSMRTGGYHDAGAVGAPWHQNRRCPRATQLSTPMLWVVLVLLSPWPLSRACAGSPSSRAPTPPCSRWPPGDPQGRLWVWHQGDHPLSLHPCIPMSPRGRQGVTMGKSSCPCRLCRGCGAGGHLVLQPQPDPSPDPAQGSEVTPAAAATQGGDTGQARPDRDEVQSCGTVTWGQGMCQGGCLAAGNVATWGLSWRQAAGSSLQRVTAGTWGQSGARGWGQGNQTELPWQHQRVRCVWGASCSAAG